MASEGKKRENFFRINVLVVDHIKNALVHMFKYYLRKKNMSFEEFIGEHMADIRKLRRRTRSLNQKEVDKLIVDDNAISGITVDDLEVTLVKRLLDNLCPDLFMDDSCITLQDFLEKNRHDIYHLFKFNERCCQCSQDYKFPVTEELLKENEYKNMFESSRCTNCAGKSKTVCSVSSCKDTEYILLDYGTRRKVFEHFSHIFKTMQKLIDIRNKAYGHIEATMIPNELYDEYKQDIEENIMVLAKICGNEHETRLALDDVQKRSCDETLCIQYQNIFIELMQREKELEKRIEELAEKCETIETNLQSVAKDIADNRQKIDRHIPLHIRKDHEAFINKWRKEDELFCDKTQGFTATLKMVEDESYMTIIGGPGSGKTATARHIALQLKEQGWEVVPVYGLDKIIKYGNRDHKQVFVLDDVLGIFAVDMNIYNHIIKLEENIVTTIIETSKLLLTCRKSVYNEALKLGSFVTKNVVDLQSEDNQLTKTEKMTICKYHCEAKGVNPDLYTSLSFTKANHMFPLLCKLFSVEEKYQQLGESFFNKPLKYFNIELDKLQRTNTIQYAVLVLCLFNKSKLSVDDLPCERMRKEFFNYCGVNLDTPVKNIKDAIYHMSETYFTKLDTEYTFTHDFAFEAIAYHYGKNGGQNQQQILEYLSSSYIANKVTVYEQDSNDDCCIQIKEDMYLPLAERLYKGIQFKDLFDVFMNNSLKHGPFLDVFEKMLKAKPFDEFESLILRNRENIDHLVQKMLSFDCFSSLPKMWDNMNECVRLNLLFGRVYSQKSDSQPSVRVISWIINYGHTHLLQEIINHVKYNNNCISLIFGSDVMENTRLLALGCFSNDLDMVELILEYIDAKCINMNYDLHSDTEYYTDRCYTPFMTACATGNLCIVKALLSRKADVNKCTEGSPLSVAARHDHKDVVRCLLSSGANVNLCGKTRISPLYEASQKGYFDMVQCLVAHNANVNLCDGYGKSPLLIASQKGHSDIVEVLVKNKADVNLCDGNKQSPLIIASQKGHSDIVEVLVKNKADVNLCDGNKQSPLIIASQEGHSDVVEVLVKNKADVNLCDGYEQSPLFTASKEGHSDIVEVLVKNKADVNLCNEYEQSPLIIASQEGHSDIVEVLVKNKADVNLCDRYGQSPLFIASKGDHLDIVEYLLENNADIDLCDSDRQSPLFIAAKKGHSDIVEVLVKNKADVNLRDLDKQSALFTASQKGHSDIVEVLVKNKADVNLCDGYEQSPLFIAAKKGNYDIVRTMVEWGANVNLYDKVGDSPISIAKQNLHFAIYKYLMDNPEVDLSDEDDESPTALAFAEEMYIYLHGQSD